jgi:hypothetical protein
LFVVAYPTVSIYIYMFVSRSVIDALGAMADALRPFKKKKDL